MKPLQLALIAILATTTACKRGDDAASPATDSRAGPTTSAQPATDTPAAAADAGDAGDEAWDEKVDAYIKVGNRLRGFSSSVNETFAKWKEEDRRKVAAGDFKKIRTDDHYFSDNDLKNLKDAIAMPGATPELDEAGQQLVAAAEALLPTWRELIDYNKAKRFEDDAGAKGKELLPKYVAGMDKLETALTALAGQIDAASKIAHDKSVARFKAEGRLLEMHTWEAMGSAEKVLDLFDNADDLKNPEKIKQADAHIAAMETSLTAMKAEHQKRKAEKDSLPMIDRYDSIADELTDFAGAYRSARKDPSEFNDAAEAYNDAVDALNMMNR